MRVTNVFLSLAFVVGIGPLTVAATPQPSSARVLPTGEHDPTTAESAQTSGHGIYFEALGPAGLYSINYEYRLRWPVALRIGASLWELCLLGTCSGVVAVPLAITTFLGSGDHYLEFGGGVTLFVLDDDTSIRLAPQFGYRYILPKGFLFRAVFTPIVYKGDGGEWNFLPFGGLSLGTTWGGQ